jgi:hypothetical protein
VAPNNVTKDERYYLEKIALVIPYIGLFLALFCYMHLEFQSIVYYLIIFAISLSIYLSSKFRACDNRSLYSGYLISAFFAIMAVIPLLIQREQCKDASIMADMCGYQLVMLSYLGAFLFVVHVLFYTIGQFARLRMSAIISVLVIEGLAVCWIIYRCIST